MGAFPQQAGNAEVPLVDVPAPPALRGVPHSPSWHRRPPSQRQGTELAPVARRSSSPEVAMTSSARAVALTVLLLGACRDASTPLQPRGGSSHDLTGQASNGQIVPGQYIVVFKDAVSDPVGLAQSLVQGQGGTLLQTYTSALKGFAARLSDAAVAALRLNPLVAYVEPDQVVHPDATQQMDANGDPWGLDRIDQRALPLDGAYTYTYTGGGVHVYLIDSGSYTAHPEFEGRADIVYDVFGLNGLDCSGHGTAVAGGGGARGDGGGQRGLPHGRRAVPGC